MASLEREYVQEARMSQAPEQQQRRQFVKYAFYKVDRSWLALQKPEREQHKREVQAVVQEYAESLSIRTFSTIGLRHDTDFLVWLFSWEIEPVQDFASHMGRTALGQYLSTPHGYLAMTRKSPYKVQGQTADSQGAQGRLFLPQKPYPYLAVYPFVKTHDWYQLPHAERQRMMGQHFTIGHKYPNVRINTTYSFGLDDQDHVVAFETDNLSDFLECVMELRESEARKYTERDTPIFTCIQKPVKDILDDIG
jgi:chlorite dismutase